MIKEKTIIVAGLTIALLAASSEGEHREPSTDKKLEHPIHQSHAPLPMESILAITTTASGGILQQAVLLQ